MAWWVIESSGRADAHPSRVFVFERLREEPDDERSGVLIAGSGEKRALVIAKGFVRDVEMQAERAPASSGEQPGEDLRLHLAEVVASARTLSDCTSRARPSSRRLLEKRLQPLHERSRAKLRPGPMVWQLGDRYGLAWRDGSSRTAWVEKGPRQDHPGHRSRALHSESAIRRSAPPTWTWRRLRLLEPAAGPATGCAACNSDRQTVRMPMDAAEKRELFEALERAQWTWRDGALYAPNGTMWLDAEEPWEGDLQSFRDRMTGRADRLRQNLRGSTEHADDAQRALLDASGLVEVLKLLLK